MTDRVVISRKQFAHLTELEANYWRNPTSETFRAVDAYQDEIGWPWKATQEQVEYWNTAINRQCKECGGDYGTAAACS